MAFLVSYTDPATGAVYPAAYLKVASAAVDKVFRLATVTIAIYATKAARAANLQPIYAASFAFNDWAGPATGATPGPVYNLYSDYFGKAPLPDSFGAVAVNVDDILAAQSYLAMQAHPLIAPLLIGATPTDLAAAPTA
jgi:hypothetical protein